MSALIGADKPGAADRPAQAATIAVDTARAGVYLTDEIFLYRIAGLASSGLGEMVELEDCYGLDVVTAPLRDVAARRLRVVTPAQRAG